MNFKSQAESELVRTETFASVQKRSRGSTCVAQLKLHRALLDQLQLLESFHGAGVAASPTCWISALAKTPALRQLTQRNSW